MGEIILIIFTLLTMLTTFCLFKMLSKRGLYFALVIFNILGLIFSFKIAYIFKMNTNLSIIPIIASLTILYIFLTKYGYKENKTLIKLSLYINIGSSILLAIMNFYIPAITETISINMEGTFEYNYKILIIYPLIVLISQYIVVNLYKLINEIQNNINISVILNYIITALIYTVLYSVLIYINTIELKASLFVGISTYIIGLPVIIINLIFINYITDKLVKK